MRTKTNRYKERLKKMTIEELYDELKFYTEIRDENNYPHDYIFDATEKYDSINQHVRDEYESLYNEYEELKRKLNIKKQLNPSNDIVYLLGLDTSLYDEWLVELTNLERRVNNKKNELRLMEIKNPELKYYEHISRKYNSFSVPVNFSLVRRIIDIKSEIIKRKKKEKIDENKNANNDDMTM